VARRGRQRGRRGDGSIIRVAGGYQARYSTTEGGVRKRHAKTFALRNDAEWWLGQAKRHGESPDDPYLRDFLAAWLAGKRNLRPSTRTQYAEHITIHLAPLGGFRLTRLRKRHVEAWVTEREGATFRRTPDGPEHPYSPATVGKALMTLRSALATAVPKQIPDNPAAGVHATSVRRPKVAAMTPTDAAAVIAAVEGTWLEHITRVLLGSGMRVGEALALNQGDVHDGWVSLRESKTNDARTVRLSADADEAIHAAIRSAPRRGPGEPVFFSVKRVRGTDSRDRLRVDSVSRNLLKYAGVRPHQLRHGAATLMVRGGVPMRAVAEQLGHADPALTARVYAHIAPDTLGDAVRVLDAAIGKR
jgi:integrase